MNKLFAESTTSVAFLLTLSKRQCNSLLRLARLEQDNTTAREDHWVMSVDGLRGLDRKGLVFWNYDKDGDACGFGGLTSAGRLTAKLLAEAGMTIESTQTTLTVKRAERFNAKA